VTVEVIPSARRLMESLRDIGYDLPAAIADLVDNSLDADAERVDVDFGLARDGAWVRIADDGVGMTERELDEAMRYGSSRAYDHGDLGHFGLGLKTASLSQCRQLTVATRTTPRGRIRIRRWDLDRVALADAWILERLGVRDVPSALLEPLDGSCGTVVMWNRLDRILAGRREGSDAAGRRLEAASTEVSEHLAMVFHRFLAREAAGPPLKIRVDGVELEPWDPFARAEPMTRRLTGQTLRLEHGGLVHDVPVQPFVLPGQHHFSSPEAHVQAGGPKRWNRHQGIYIYRRDRLIQAGGWNRLRTLDEHSKLARIALDVPAAADGAFRTNVAKMTVGLPEVLRPQLRALAAGVAARAQDVYRRRVDVVPTTAAESQTASESSGLALGDQWPVIYDVLTRELGDHPQLLDRVLVALVNARPVVRAASG
jgi:hypothetical protein